ncbi:MAG: DotU family type IV/VI secretion system protein [Planctomycetota bacterium]|nr:DotU family type IV/VI secretion system protein [Planctomycetota bacterium]
MTPKFAQAVDPIFLHVLELLDRIARDERISPQDERLRVRALIDQAQAFIGNSQEWDLAKYAIVSWIDEVLLEAPWQGREWWSNNVLEVEMFNTRLCNEMFYVRAQEASSLQSRDALEVFYVCVVLGFRGLYRDPTIAAMFTQVHGLPPDLESWAKQASLAIRLGQGRPPLAGPRRQIAGAPPLRTRPLVVWSWLSAALLSVMVVVFYTLFIA